MNFPTEPISSTPPPAFAVTPWQPGHVLRPGVTVLDSRMRGYDEAVVLCLVPESNEPYVTWAAGLDGNTYSGHYHRSLFAACEDFFTR